MRDSITGRFGPGEARTLEARFWEKVLKTEACWLWVGSTDAHGYGSIRVGSRPGKLHKAHRVSYELTNGTIPDGLYVLHHCDNPPCVRPDHLFLGTAKDNGQDMVRKGRGNSFTKPWTVLRGEAIGTAKLAEDQVSEIRRRWEEGQVARLAKVFGVSKATIWLIVGHHRWNHI